MLEPATLFDDLKEKPTWLTPFIIVSLISIVIALLMQPAQAQLVVQQLQEKMSPEMVEQVISKAKSFNIVGLAITPLMILLKWSILSALVLVVSFLFTENFKYKQAFSIVSYSSLVLLLGDVFNTGIIYLKGIESITGPFDLSNIGLNVFFSLESTGMGMYSFLSEITVFAIWNIVIVAIGFMGMANLNKVKAGTASAIVWLVVVGIKVGFAVLGSTFSMG